MRVLVINSDNLQTSIGGLGIVIHNLMQYWGEEDHLDVIGFNGEDVQYAPNVNYRALKFHRVCNVEPSTFLTLFVQPELVAEALTFPKPDLIVATDWTCALAAIALKRIYNVPYIFWSHLSPGSYCVDDILGFVDVEEKVEFTALEQADHVLHVSESYSRKFPFNVFSHKTSSIHNGINLDEFLFKAENPYKYPDKFNILFIGRPVIQKGIYKVLEAKIPDGVCINWAMADKGSNAPHNMAAIKAKCDDDPEHHQFIGDIRKEIKSNYFNWCDAVIIPSLSEPFGIVGLEALACKKLVISTMSEGLGDFLKEDFAIKCKPDPVSIEQAIIKAVSLTEDERSVMKEKAYQVALNHNWKKIIPQIKELLRKQTI